MADDAAGSMKGVKRPRNWDKAVSCAYLRLLGASQAKAAARVGCSERSVRSWERSPWWRDATEEARERWLADGDKAAMNTLLQSLATGNPKVAMWWADRRVAELVPPALRAKLEVGGVDGSAPVVAEVVFVKPDGSVGDGSGE